MKYTKNLQLYKWDPADKKVDTITEMSNNAEKIDAKFLEMDKTLADNGVYSERLGNLTELNTTAKKTIVEAVNETLEVVTSANDEALSAKTTAETVRSEFDQVVAEAGSSNPEVVLARGGEVNLGTRLEKFASSLAEKANQSDVDLNLAIKVNKLSNTIASNLGGTKKIDLGLKRHLFYNAPSGFNWQNNPLVGHLFADGEGNFATDFDVTTLAPTGKTYYVNGTTGLDTNDGLTAGTALKSVHIAAKKADAVEIIVASGYYDDGVAMNGWAIDKDISIKAASGADVTLSTRRNQAGVWNKTAGYNNIYQVTRSLVAKVFDKKFPDAFGDATEYTLASSLSALDTTPGRIFISGSTLYVHTLDSRLPDVDVTVFLDLYNVSHFGGKTIYLENIKFEGGKYPAYMKNDANLDTLFLAKGCTFKYSTESGSDGFSNYGCTSILQDCEFAKNSDDGISYTAFGTKPTQGIEIDCISKNNGASGGNDNGTTAHDGANVIRVNSAYYKNKGPNLADVGGSQSWNVGCVVGESAGTVGQSSHRGSVSSINNGVSGTKIWLDGCTIYGNTTDIHTDDNCFTYIRNTSYITSNEKQIQY